MCTPPEAENEGTDSSSMRKMSFYTIRRIAFKEEKQDDDTFRSRRYHTSLGHGPSHGGQFEIPLIDPGPLQISRQSFRCLLHRYDTERERRPFIGRWPD